MTQSKEVVNLKRMKYLLRIFLKQFHIDEYKLLMQYLQLTINRYKSNSLSDVLGQSNNKRRRKNAPVSKIATIEQTISMLKSRTNDTPTCQISATSPANSDETNKEDNEILSEVSLDDEELKLINSSFAKEDLGEEEDPFYEDDLNGNEYDNSNCDVENFSYNSENLQYNDEETSTVTYNNTPVKLYNNKSFPQQQKRTSDNYDEASEYYGYGEREVGEVYQEEDDYMENESNYMDMSGQNKPSSYGQPHNLNASMPILTSQLTSTYKAIQSASRSRPKVNTSLNVKTESAVPKANPVVLAKNSSSTNGCLAAANIYQAHSQSPKKFIRKFNEEIRVELEAKFAENNFISGAEKDQLAVKLNLTERQVKKWFEKRREKKRRIEKMTAAGHACKIGRPPSCHKTSKTPNKKINELSGSQYNKSQRRPTGNHQADLDYNNQNEDYEEYDDARYDTLDGAEGEEEFGFNAQDGEYYNDFEEAEGENQMASMV